MGNFAAHRFSFRSDSIPSKATFTDIDLPEGQTRDGSWNTNNVIERAFRSFDSIFLDCATGMRQVIWDSYAAYLMTTLSGRIDRVAGILVAVYFDYYEQFADTSPRLPKEWKDLCVEALGIWEDAKVEAVPGQEHVYQIWHFDDGVETGFRACLRPPACTCRHWDQSGKICVHLKAASLLSDFGPASVWKGKCTNFCY